jgi:hypothetical protein
MRRDADIRFLFFSFSESGVQDGGWLALMFRFLLILGSGMGAWHGLLDRFI